MVAGVGIEPNVELAAAAGLPIANGIVVDALGRVAGREDVFAAGDVARFPCPALGGELRVEHEDHAKNHGKLVGANMAGAAEPYDYLPFFYSDLFDFGYEAVGELDSRLDMVIDGEDAGRADDGLLPRRRATAAGSPALEHLRAGGGRERADPRRQARRAGRSRSPPHMSFAALPTHDGQARGAPRVSHVRSTRRGGSTEMTHE